MKFRPHILAALLTFSLIFLNACQAATSEYTEVSPLGVSISTALPASETPTRTKPTSVPTSSPSPKPTATNEPLAVLPGCPLQPFNFDAMGQVGTPINTENAGQVVCLGRWGRGIIYEVDYSPNGERLAVKSALGITLYEVESLQEIAFLEIPVDDRLGPMLQPGMTNLMGFSADGEILAAAVGERVLLYSAIDSSLLRELVGKGENYTLMTSAFSPDGKLLAGSEGWSQDVNVWQVEDGRLLYSWREEVPAGLTFSPDGRLLVSSNGHVRELSDGSLLYDLEIGGCCLNQLNFSPDGEYMTATWDQDGTLKMWRTEDGKLLHSFDGYGSVLFSADSSKVTFINPGGEVQVITTAGREMVSSYTIDDPEFASNSMLSFSPDGARFVTGNYDGVIKIWDLSNGQLIYALKGHPGNVSMAQFSPDGEVLVSADETWVRTWRVSDGSPFSSRRLAYPAAIFSPDKSILVTELKRYWTGMQVWNANDGGLRYTLEDARWPLAFSADGDMFATSERKISDTDYISDVIQVRRTLDGTPVFQLDMDDNEFDNPNYDLAFSPEGSFVAAVHDPGDILVWQLPESEPLYRLSVTDFLPFVKLALSPDGRYLATGNTYHTVQIWGLESGEMLQELEMEPTEIMGTSGAVSDLVFSPDGNLMAAVDEGGFYQIWQVSDWTTLQHDTDFINQYDVWRSAVGMAFSPDGTILATAGTGNAISLWDVASGSLLNTLRGHVDDIVRVDFSPDGRWMYSASLDGTVRFWGP